MPQPRGVIRRLADATGLDHKTVRHAMTANNLSEAECEVDFEAAVDAVSTYADTDRVIGHASNGRGEGGNRLSSDYTNAKAQLDLHRVRKLELQNAVLEGSLIDRDDVTETGSRIIASVKVGLLALGYRVADKVAGKSDTTEIARIIETEVRDVLGVLADPDRFFAILEAETLG